ncbi:glycosyltransferase family 2 protein [Spirochaeta cellobiosiphila]|uniref:glycosyltransferase family 2 protein n=1 Tax=Spirochaeta cellobiosiphila TaxID=504483 RepID=UPI00041EDEDE|nr:glycosyltransferase family 2 protein [Spirochaeta cellobiosiphila]
MKLLSVIVPCYNSQDYMGKCLDSLLSDTDEVLEVLIINDGSTDQTSQIGQDYEQRYPHIVKLVNQDNKGHGGAVNTGITNATGEYIKVVDSDDWVEESALSTILTQLKSLHSSGESIDMLVSNFVYEKLGAKMKKTIRYTNALPQNTVFTWNDIKSFRKGQYLLMHSLIYRRALLIESGLILPEHTFYVDNLFAFIPLPYVKKLYYLNVDFYRYFIGREDQSVNEQVMIKRIDQQLKVNQIMIDHMLNTEFTNAKLKRYMRHFLEIIMTVSSILLIRSRQEENLNKKNKLWRSVKYQDPYLYRRLRYGLFGLVSHLPGRLGRSISITCYKISQKTFGFN